ncbi:response regulator [Eggerthellaceae bacterium zg-886]|uniref:Response regulator n=2 Tax=Xiamenia xianingshaonis TaxID=2682776 RepID=A0ABX0IIL0_9ACTN|nr:response regulator [Xiamenia xianingshaonis]
MLLIYRPPLRCLRSPFFRVAARPRRCIVRGGGASLLRRFTSGITGRLVCRASNGRVRLVQAALSGERRPCCARRWEGAIRRMNRLAIVDDDKQAALTLKDLVLEYPQEVAPKIEVFLSAQEFEEALDAGASFNIVFMDICLDENGEASGIDVVKSRYQSDIGTQIIYVTSFIEHCTDVYQTNHAYFLVKPVKREKLFEALDKACANLDQLSREALPVKQAGRLIFVPLHKIAYIESDLRKIKIKTPDGTLEMYGKLSEIMKQLPDRFIQCHRSFLVNLDYVQALQKKELLLSTGEEIPISQHRYQATRDCLVKNIHEGSLS